MLAFVIFYGLDWVATVPPTLALTREAFGASAPVVFGWVFASHQLGAACAALAAGIARDALGSYDAAWYGGAVLCVDRRGAVGVDRRPVRRLGRGRRRVRVATFRTRRRELTSDNPGTRVG